MRIELGSLEFGKERNHTQPLKRFILNNYENALLPQ